MASQSLAVRVYRGGWTVPRLDPAVSHTARTVAAALLALYAAYALQLESPGSAATTVLIVASTSRGAILSKCLWRVVGTLVGATMAVVLMSWFAQAPLLFVAAVGLWLGACTMVASVLRHFRAYAAVLAGYTISLIAFGPAALARPDTILEVALARGAAVVVGVLAAAFVNILLQPRTPPALVVARANSLAMQTAALLGRALRGETGLEDTRRQLARALDDMDAAVEFSAAESYETRRQANALRTGMAWLFAALTGGMTAVAVVRDLAEAPVPEHRRLGAAAIEALAPLLRGGEPGGLHARATRAADDIEALIQQTADVPALAALAAASALAHELAEAGECLENPRARGIRLRRWRNWPTALRNGLRATIAVNLAGLFWIETAWPAGGTMLSLLGPLCGLLGTMDSAAAASVMFLKGATLAIIAALVCEFGVLNNISGFPLLAAAIAIFIGPAVYVSTLPRFAGIATPYLIVFSAITSPTNPMRFDLAGFLNTASGFWLSTAFGVLAFRVLLPPDAARDVRLAACSIRASVQRLARQKKIPDQLVWEHARHQTLLRLSSRLPVDPEARRRELDGGVALMLIGRLVLRARIGLGGHRLPRPVRALASRALLAVRRPHEMRQAGVAEQAADALRLAGLPRVAASFHAIQFLLDRNADFIERKAS